MTSHLAFELNADLLELIGAEDLESLRAVPGGSLDIFFAVIERQVLESQDASEAGDIREIRGVTGSNENNDVLLFVLAGLKGGEVVQGGVNELDADIVKSVFLVGTAGV